MTRGACWRLLALAGVRPDDDITNGEMLTLLWQQWQLNVAPGSEMLDSNSGYTLLGRGRALIGRLRA